MTNIAYKAGFIDSIRRSFASAVFNPHSPSEPVHLYQLDESISNFRRVWCTFSFLFYFK